MSRNFKPLHETVPRPKGPLTRADLDALASAVVGAIRQVTESVAPAEPEPAPEPTAAELAAMPLEDRDRTVQGMWADRLAQAGPSQAQAAIARGWADFQPRTGFDEPGAV